MANEDLFAGLIINDEKQPELANPISQPITQESANNDDLFEGLIVNDKLVGPQPDQFVPLGHQKQPIDNRSRLQMFSDFVSGADRKTPEIEGLSENFLPLLDPDADFFSMKNLKRQGKLFNIALGMMTTFDPDRQAKIFKENFPKLKFSEDKKGNIIVDAGEEGGEIGVLDMPGLSVRNLAQAGFQIAAFTPAAKMASLFTTTAGKALAVGGASAVTQAAQDLTAQATGATEDVKPGNINLGDVAIAGITGGGLEVLFKGLSSIVPLLRQTIVKEGITRDVRETFRSAAKEFGVNPNEINDNVIRLFVKSADESTSPGATAAIQGEKEFRINLTKGQRSENQKQLSFEDSSRAGIFGGKAQEKLLTKEAQTNKEILEATEGVQQRVSGRSAPIESQQEAGALARQGIQQSERAFDAGVREAFESVGDASLSGKGFVKLLTAVRDSVKSPEFLKSEGLALSSHQLLGQINRFLKTVGTQAKEIKPQDIKQIELMRRTIGAHIKASANPSDKRTLTVMKNGFDDFMDKAVTKALFSGDQGALDALKQSRSLFAEYAGKFRANPIKTKSGRTIADKEGNFIETIIAGNPTDEQTINALFGAGNTFGNQSGANMAIKFKDILGKDSHEWQSIKQAAFMRLIKFSPDKKTVSGSKTLSAISEAVGKNNSLIKELFSAQELGLIRRLAAQIKRAQPDLVRSRENPSGTAQVLMKSISAMISKSGQAIGFATGNPLFVIGSKGVEIGSGFRAASKARKAVKPFEKVTDIKTLPVSSGTAAAVAGGN